MSIVNNLIETAALLKSKRAAMKLNAILKARALLDEMENSSSDEEKLQKKLILEAFTNAILETL